MTTSDTPKWAPSNTPKVGDILKWTEPLWAAPNKPRGKRDKIGEQEVIAELIKRTDVLEFKVLSAQKKSTGDAPISVRENDYIKRKQSSIDKGDCHKRID